MKNFYWNALKCEWKTTLTGIIAGLPLAVTGILQVVATGGFTGQTKTEIAAGIGLILLGVHSKDAPTKTE